MSENKKLKIMSLSVPPEMHQLLGDAAKKMGWSTSNLIRELVNRYLDLVVQDNEEIQPVVLRIPNSLRTDKEKLHDWLHKKANAIVEALCKE
jgi:hypothetical protein